MTYGWTRSMYVYMYIYIYVCLHSLLIVHALGIVILVLIVRYNCTAVQYPRYAVDREASCFVFLLLPVFFAREPHFCTTYVYNMKTSTRSATMLRSSCFSFRPICSTQKQCGSSIVSGRCYWRASAVNSPL